MKILWVNWGDIKSPKAGGAEVFQHELSKRLVKKGHTVVVLTHGLKGGRRQEIMGGYRIIRIGNWRSFSFSAFRWVKENGYKFDIIIESTAYAIPLYLSLLYPSKVVAIVYHLNRSFYFREVRGRLFAFIPFSLEVLMPYFYTHLLKTPIVTISRSSKEEIIKLGADPQLVICIHSGINHSKYKAKTPPSWEEKTSFPSLLYLGKLIWHKRPTHVIDSFKLISEKFPDSKLYIAGRGELYDELKKFKHKLNLGDSVKLLGFVSQEKKVKLYKKSWLHVTGSAKEGWGLTVLEAAACGTPTVAYKIPGLSDSIIDGKTGVLVDKEDPKALARAVIRLLSHKEVLKGMSHRAYLFSKNFSWERSSNKIESLLKEVASRT